MIRIFLLGVIALAAALIFLEGRSSQHSMEKPVFLQIDNIAAEHKTNITTAVHSVYKPNPTQLEILQQDYSNLWAHLNYLFQTNNTEAGKEYYTENWFKQICLFYNGEVPAMCFRKDISHQLHIQNWASDALICTAIDSNAVFTYTFKNDSIITKKTTMAVVLLQQGDHWRIDALRIIKDETISNL
jgi:hypothetical protein